VSIEFLFFCDKVNFTRKKLDEYFPSDYSAEKREEIILGLLSDWKKQREEVGNV
jgi:ParB family chromosome partitioning protein